MNPTPSELADELELCRNMSPVDEQHSLVISTAEILLIAAALRLAEAAEHHDANCRSNDAADLWRGTFDRFHDALAAYREARSHTLPQP